MTRSILRALALLSLAAAPAAAAPRIAPPATLDTVVVAGGCFWGVQAVFQHLKGVVSATSGYAGGTVADPGYERVSTGRTGHAEAVRVVYDPAVLPFDTLLEVFFTVAHDPTQLNRQGPDVGTQYRSALFYGDAAQHAAVARYLATLERSGRVKGAVVTQVAPLRAFYEAEAYHQDYATRHPDEPYIAYHDAPKIEALRTRHPALWRASIASH